MIDKILEIVGKDTRIVAGHKLIEAQLDYVFEEDGEMYRTSVPLIRDGSVLIVVLPPDTKIVGMETGQIDMDYKGAKVPATS